MENKVECFFLDHDEVFLFVRDDPTYFVVGEKDYTLDATFPLDPDKPISDGMKIGFHNINGDLVFYDIRKAEEDVFGGTVDIVSAELSAMAELLDEVIVDIRPTQTTAGAAVTAALTSTRWSLGVAETTAAQSCRFWYTDAWSSLQKIVSVWGCELSFRWEINDSGIAGRYVDVKQHPGQARGKRFDTRKDVSALTIIYDDSDVCTALYGRGRGEELTSADGDTAYGRKLSFADVVWSRANGDPCDKPADQEWVEDTAATVAYGRSGRKRSNVVTFDDCNDPEELLSLTWAALQEVNKPKVSIRGTFSDFERIWGYSHEAVRMNDIVTVISGKSIQIQTRVVDIRRNYLNPDQTQVSIGNDVLTIADVNARYNRSIKDAKEAAAYGTAIASMNPSLLQGFIDTMATKILSTGTNFYTDEDDGSFIFENTLRTAAVKITGNGILISNQRISDAWVWSTALSGTGIVADTITSGVLQAQLIRILGNSNFFWDALNIICSNPTDVNQQIRFGCYDGTNYGIGFTRNGGQTWESALDFTGAHISTQERYSSVSSSNSSITFAADSDGIVAAQSVVYSYIYAFTGHNRVVPVISSITGMPAGMTAVAQSALADGSVPIRITVAAGSNLGSSGELSAQLTVHVTSPIETNILINWIKVNDGGDGQPGQPGQPGRDGEDGSKTYYGSSEPDPLVYDLNDGDLFFNSSNNNRMYRWNSQTSAWVPVSDTSIDSIRTALVETKAELDVAKDNINAIVQGTYITNDDLQDTISTLKSELLQADSDLQALFSRTITDTQGTILQDISTLIRASGDGVEVGRSDSHFKTLLSNDRLSFIQTENGTSVEVAYISDHKLYITDAQVTNELAIGDGVHRLFKWRRTSNGLILVYQS